MVPPYPISRVCEHGEPGEVAFDKLTGDWWRKGIERIQ